MPLLDEEEEGVASGAGANVTPSRLAFSWMRCPAFLVIQLSHNIDNTIDIITMIVNVNGTTTVIIM